MVHVVLHSIASRRRWDRRTAPGTRDGNDGRSPGSSLQGWQLRDRHQDANAAGLRWYALDEPALFQRDHHLMHAGRRHPEVALYVGLGRGAAVELGIVVDECQILALFLRVLRHDQPSIERSGRAGRSAGALDFMLRSPQLDVLPEFLLVKEDRISVRPQKFIKGCPPDRRGLPHPFHLPVHENRLVLEPPLPLRGLLCRLSFRFFLPILRTLRVPVASPQCTCNPLEVPV